MNMYIKPSAMFITAAGTGMQGASCTTSNDDLQLLKDVFGIDNVLQFVDEAKRENNRPVLLLIQDNETVHFAAIKPDGDSK